MNNEVLIIHPFDESTNFLTEIYKDIPNKLVIRNGYTFDEISEMIDTHERIFMMGHGTPFGLLSISNFQVPRGYVIDSYLSEKLIGKNECIYIWCNADMFMNFNPKLKGFYSGMFISEVVEADYMGLKNITQEMIDESNYGFSEIFKKYSNESVDVIYKNVVEEYKKIGETNPVAYYNSLRLFKR